MPKSQDSTLSFFKACSLATVISAFVLLSPALQSVARAGGSSIGNGGHQLCVEGATEVFMEADSSGMLQNRVVYTCHNGQFQNLAYKPQKIVYRTCKEGDVQSWPSGGEGHISTDDVYVCHHGVYKKRW